jgi:hypothetical protein
VVDGNGAVVHDYFACYDGEVLLKSKPMNTVFAGKGEQHAFRIFRTGNTFQFFETLAATGKSDLGNWESNYGSVGKWTSNVMWVPRQINFETGEIY